MLKRIYSPTSALVIEILVKKGERFRSGQMLMKLQVNDSTISITAHKAGWVCHIFVKNESIVTKNQALLLVDINEFKDLRPDSNEINPGTELGEAGRRGHERKGQRVFGQPSSTLFDALETQQGIGAPPRIKTHPWFTNRKKGATPKMEAQASANQPAIERTAENASHDPELQKKLSPEARQQLQIGSTLTKTPTLGR